MSPETFTSLLNLGAAGAVIIVVILFLRSNERRDKQWQEFMDKQAQSFKERNEELAIILRGLVVEFKFHAAETNKAISTMNERTRPQQRLQRKHGEAQE
jgi:hypothetical protein